MSVTLSEPIEACRGVCTTIGLKRRGKRLAVCYVSAEADDLDFGIDLGAQLRRRNDHWVSHTARCCGTRLFAIGSSSSPSWHGNVCRRCARARLLMSQRACIRALSWASQVLRSSRALIGTLLWTSQVLMSQRACVRALHGLVM